MAPEPDASAVWTPAERRAWRPRPRLTLSQWADRYRVLPSADAEPGPFRTERFPLLREIQDTLGDPGVRKVVLWGPAQCAKTTAYLNFVGFCIHHDPARTLIVLPTEDKATEFSTEKLEPMLESCPALARKAGVGTARTHRKSVLSKTFPGMNLLIRGGNSKNPFSSGSFRNVILDELDRIPANEEGRALNLAEQRVTTFWNYKLILASTCTIEGQSEIQAEYLRGDQRQPYVPCLGCGTPQVLAWEQLRWDGTTPAEAAASARYVCVHCGHAHHEADKPRLLQSVQWRPQHPAGTFPSFWWSGLYSPFGLLTWGKIASEWLEAQGDDDALMVHVNCRQARTWQVQRDSPAESTLAACVDADRPAGQVPEAALLLTGGADVQKAVVYFVVRAWGREGRSWLVSHGTVERDGPGLDRLDEVFATLYDGREVRQVLVDSGWDEEVVYDYCLRRRNCAPCKGVPVDRPYVIKEAEQTREKGQYLGRRFFLWMVNSHRLREHIHDRIGLPADQPRSWRLHADADAAYRQQLTSWARQVKRVKGRATVEWVQVRSDDHWLDAEIYALAAARLPHIAPLLVTQPRPAGRSWSERRVDRRQEGGWNIRGPIRRVY